MNTWLLIWFDTVNEINDICNKVESLDLSWKQSLQVTHAQDFIHVLVPDRSKSMSWFMNNKNFLITSPYI
jgi:hypothetical protein